MSCHLLDVPQYLHWNNRQVFNDVDFIAGHFLYRASKIGNPIEFPAGTITALSCKWSNLIEACDLFRVNDPPLGDCFYCADVPEIRAVKLKKQKDVGDYLGFHLLSCSLLHKPENCDYSHCEILIYHAIFSDEEETNLLNEWLYTYEIWQENALLKSDSKFYKNLRKDYRVATIKLFR